jgi:hypothetical protein
MKKRGFIFYGKWVVLGIAGFILFTFVVMWLWNWLVPALFKGPVVTYWQTLGLLVLSKILFSGIGAKGHDRHRYSHDHDCSGYRDRWHKKYQEKMNGKVEGAAGPVHEI